MAHELTKRITQVADLEEAVRFGSGQYIEEGGHHWAALRAGGVVHAVALWRIDGDHEFERHLPDGVHSGEVLQPIAAGTTLADLDGATHVHDDGKVFHFSHCSPAEQVDLAASVRTFAFGQFAGPIARATVKVGGASNGVARADKAATADAVIRFAEAVGDMVYAGVVGSTLGHFHRGPGDHFRDLTAAAIDAVIAVWSKKAKLNQKGRDDLAAVTSIASGIKTSLGLSHTIEHRAVRAARLAAEAAAKEKAVAAEESAPADDSAGDQEAGS